MSNAGIFFALGALELAAMEARVSAGDQRAWAEDAYTELQTNSPSRILDVDHSWDAIHRCLGDGSLKEEPAEYPLQAVVLGGTPLGDDKGLIMRLNVPPIVQKLAPEVVSIGEAAFRSCYFSIPADSYLIVPNEADFQYTWDYFQQVQLFYGRAAENGEAVLFIAYQ